MVSFFINVFGIKYEKTFSNKKRALDINWKKFDHHTFIKLNGKPLSIGIKGKCTEKEEKLSISPLFLGYGLKGQLVHVIETVQHGPQSNNKNSSLFFFHI